MIDTALKRFLSLREVRSLPNEWSLNLGLVGAAKITLYAANASTKIGSANTTFASTNRSPFFHSDATNESPLEQIIYLPTNMRIYEMQTSTVVQFEPIDGYFRGPGFLI
jgi:hypothetical protein